MNEHDIEPFEIKKYPDEILRENSVKVEEITDKELKLLERMFFTMKYFKGIGLAAPQIGISERLIVTQVESRIIKLANPEILKLDGADKMVEGCLSVLDAAVDVERPYKVVVTGLDENSKIVEIKAEGLLARVLQHEIDHLNGKLIIDYLPFGESFLKL